MPTTFSFLSHGLKTAALLCLAAMLPLSALADPVMWFEPFIINGQNTGNGFGTADLGTGIVTKIQITDLGLAEASLAFAPGGTLWPVRWAALAP